MRKKNKKEKIMALTYCCRGWQLKIEQRWQFPLVRKNLVQENRRTIKSDFITFFQVHGSTLVVAKG